MLVRGSLGYGCRFDQKLGELTISMELYLAGANHKTFEKQYEAAIHTMRGYSRTLFSLVTEAVQPGLCSPEEALSFLIEKDV